MNTEINILDRYYNRDGVYQGPETLEEAEVQSDSKLTSLGRLKKVEGELGLFDSPIAEAPNLEEVQELNITYSPINYFPSLKSCPKLFCREIPICPKLTGNTLVTLIFEGEMKILMYHALRDKVRDTPVDMLVSLRGHEPYLKHLIDQVLKGGEI